MKNFMEQCMEDNSIIEKVDDFIDEWHNGNSNKSLPEYLGMTEKEYAIFLGDSTLIPLLIYTRELNMNAETQNEDDVIKDLLHCETISLMLDKYDRSHDTFYLSLSPDNISKEENDEKEIFLEENSDCTIISSKTDYTNIQMEIPKTKETVMVTLEEDGNFEQYTFDKEGVEKLIIMLQEVNKIL